MSRIGVFTATRAEYGLLAPVLDALERSAALEPVLIVSGAHLSFRHGETVHEIEADGRTIAARLTLPMTDDTPVAIAADMGTLTASAARAYADLKLDAVLILGDRTEALAAAAAAVPLALPILHLEGGHVTEGAVDDGVRHALTKLGALHFTAAEPYRRRLLQLGEAPDRVFTVGSTALDRLRGLPPLSLADLSADLDADLTGGFLLATFHPETLSRTAPAAQVEAFLSGVERSGRRVLFTLPNADAGSDAVRAAVEAFVAARPDRAFARASLGARRYMQAMRLCDAVIGNSSSGVIEAPALKAPSVNVGDRQKGRLRPPGVVDCPAEADAVAAAIERAADPAFRAALSDAPAPFGDGHAADRIVEVLERTDFAALLPKPFVDQA